MALHMHRLFHMYTKIFTTNLQPIPECITNNKRTFLREIDMFNFGGRNGIEIWEQNQHRNIKHYGKINCDLNELENNF